MDYFFDAPVFDTRHKMGVILAIKHLNPTRNNRIVLLKYDFVFVLLVVCIRPQQEGVKTTTSR